MRLDPLLRVLFLLYCVEAGLFLFVTPWLFSWDRSWLQVPSPTLRALFLHSATRGAVSGFGLVHLIWGAHDLGAWIGTRRARGVGRPPP